MSSKEPTKPYFSTGLRKSQKELDWEAECRVGRDKSPYPWNVSVGCTVPQKDGPRLHQGDEVDPDRILGGLSQVRRWAQPLDGYVQQTDERTWRTNAGEYEFLTKKAFTTGDTVYGPGTGFNSDELDMSGEPEYQAIGEHGKLITRPGRPAVSGAELAESLIVRGLAERARLRDAVIAKAKKILKREASVKASE